MGVWMRGAAFGLAVLVGGVTVAQHEGGAAAKPAAMSALCPVMGEPVNLAVSTETPEGPVFFCCAHCIPSYQADPAKFADKVAAQRKALATLPKAQVLCPTCKHPADRKVSLEPEGQKILFCSEDCMNKYKAEPAKYASSLANSYTFQTKCPVMEEPINPKSYATLENGQKVYFCCKGCDKKLFAEPEKYASKLAEQGVKIPAKDIKKGVEKRHEGHDH